MINIFFGSEHKTKGMNKNVVAAINHNEYKDILLNKKYLRHLMNRILSKDCRIRPTKSTKASLSCFDDKIYIQNNGYDELGITYQS